MLALLLVTLAAAVLATASARSATTRPTPHHDLNFIPPSVESFRDPRGPLRTAEATSEEARPETITGTMVGHEGCRRHRPRSRLLGHRRDGGARDTADRRCAAHARAAARDRRGGGVAPWLPRLDVAAPGRQLPLPRVRPGDAHRP